MLSDNDLKHITSEAEGSHWDRLGIRFPSGRCASGEIYCLEKGCSWSAPRPQKHWYGTDLLNDLCLICGNDRRKEN